MTHASSAHSISPSAWIYFGLCGITVVDAFLHSEFLVQIGVGLIVVFMVLEFRRVPAPQKISATVLIVLAVIAAGLTGKWDAIILEGISRARIFLILFFAIAWLQFPVKKSPSLNAVRSNIVSRPPGRRYLFLTSGVHILGSVLNLAGLSLLTTIVERQKQSSEKRRLSVALMQGFTTASCWSPFYIGMIVVLISIPGVTWLELAPAGAVMAVCALMTGWAYDRILLRASRAGRVPDRPSAVSRRHLVAAVFILCSLVGLAMVMVEFTGTNIPVTLSIMGPVYALIWFGSLRTARESRLERYRQLSFDAVGSLSGYRNEVLLFVAANMFGAGIAAVLPSGDMSAALNALVPWPDIKIILLMVIFLVSSAAGLHPVIVVISVSAVFPPSSLGLDDWIMALALLGAWGVSTMVSPFSGTTLFMSRVAGVPGHVIGWRWSPPMVLVTITVITVYIICLRNFFT
ncbi:MAG: hypothetical protein CBD27_01305 [Rhodospirillaceae bacterium TMED167]|nr:hypothetical protein [Rhodospirillaceae bacterium]OUW30499.1 MAG: hypothetical protein CBD27_01305 [Rhodospirillaceae bacterium TMED167]